MKELLTKNIAEFISMDVEQTVKLCDHWFDQDYIGIIDSLTDQNDLAFNFLNTVLNLKEADIILEYEN